MKTTLAGPNAMSRIRVFLIATCIIAVTPRLYGDIILFTRLSAAEAHFYYGNVPPPQSQTGFLPANLSNSAGGCVHQPLIGQCCGAATSTSNSSIMINNAMEGLRVVGDGTATANGCFAWNDAKVIFLTFSLTEVSYPWSITGQLNGASARFALTDESGTIIERVGTTLSESGTLPPGIYTLSVDVNGNGNTDFTFALDGPTSTPAPTPPVTLATNLSTRLLVGTGDDVGIGGFIITGNGPRYLLLRGIGPSLGVPHSLDDPTLELHGPAGFATITNTGEIRAKMRLSRRDVRRAVNGNPPS